jgi:hypothetical protein
MQQEFKDANEFIERLVDSSFNGRDDENPPRSKRLSFLRQLKAHETNPDDFDFDSLQQDRLELERELKENHRLSGADGKYRPSKTLFDLLNMLAEGKLRDKNKVARELPDWLLRGLLKLRVGDEERTEEVEAEESAILNDQRPEYEEPDDDQEEDKRPSFNPFNQQEDEEEGQEEERSPSRNQFNQEEDDERSPRFNDQQEDGEEDGEGQEEESELEDQGRRSVGGRSPKRSRRKAPRHSVRSRSKSSERKRVSVGGRAFELEPAQRVALHFAVPGEASRETLLQFVGLVQPAVKQETIQGFDMSTLRDYAYDLWLALTDDQLMEFAEQFSGNTGVIHPVIQQELEDAVRKYEEQWTNVKENGKRAVQKLKSRASTLPRAEQAKFQTCLNGVEQALDQERGGNKTQCTKINPLEKMSDKELWDIGRKPTKWLIRDPTNLAEAKFLTDLSPAELQKFSNYLVSQSAVGNCRMSQYLTSLAETCEKDIEKSKDDGEVPNIDSIETLRFIEWVIRRPVNPKNQTSVPLWLLRYPYVEGVHVEGKLPLSAKYRNFKPKTAEDMLLSSIFGATNKQNIQIMKMAYNKRFTSPF